MNDPITKTAEELQRMAYHLAIRSITDRGFFIQTSFALDITCTVGIVDTSGKMLARGEGADIAQASSIMMDNLRTHLLKRAKDMSNQATESVKAADRAIKILEGRENDKLG